MVIVMCILWFVNGLNIIFDLCFIFGWGLFFEMGVIGVVVVINIGCGIGVVY